MNNSSNITLLISSLSGGGAEAVCVSLANGFAEHGWDVDWVLLNKKAATWLSVLKPFK
jgi:hypothetical protein